MEIWKYFTFVFLIKKYLINFFIFTTNIYYLCIQVYEMIVNFNLKLKYMVYFNNLIVTQINDFYEKF